MSTKEENKLDSIFHAMGELKAFTVCQILVSGLVYLPVAYHLLNNVFIAQDVPHKCASAPNDSTQLLTGLGEYNYQDLNITYHKCQIVVSYNDTVLKTEGCIHGMAYDRPKDASVISQFDLVCDFSALSRLSQTLVIAGQGIGALFFTILSDRFGRKTILVICNLAFLPCGFIVAYAPNYTTFAAFKFVGGALQQGCAMTFSTLVLEMLTTKKRRIHPLCAGGIWGFSVVSLSLWAYLFRFYSWRTLQMVLTLSSLPVVLQWWYLKESLRWLIANGKSKAAVSYIRHATKVNKTSFEGTLQAYDDANRLLRRDKVEEESSLDTQNIQTGTKKLSILDLLQVKRLLLNAVIMWSAWFTTALSFFALYLMSTKLAGDPYLNYFLTSLMEIPSNFVLYALLDRYGRKVTLIVVYTGVSVGLILSGVFRSLEENTVNSTLAMIFSCLAMLGSSASFNLVYFYTPELFPTNMRNQAVGMASIMGRIGGMIAPFTGILILFHAFNVFLFMYFQSEKAQWGPGVLIGCCAFVVCVASTLLPETRGRELPQTIEDVKAWFAKPSQHKRLISTGNEKTADNQEL